MSNKKKLKDLKPFIAVLLAICLLCIHSVVVFADRAFNDIEHSYAADAIETMAAQGYVTGYEDGSFRPLYFISRQEFASIFAKMLKRTSNNYNETSFRDVSLWAQPYVQALQEERITKGISEELFGARQNLTRQDMVVWYARYFGVSEDSQMTVNPSFVDQSDISDYARTSVWLMERLELIEGDTNQYFHPKQFVTRQDATLVAYRIWLGGNKVKERAQRLLAGDEAGTFDQPSNPQEPNNDGATSVKPLNPDTGKTKDRDSKPVTPGPPVTPPGPDPGPPVTPPGPDPGPPVTPPGPDPGPPVTPPGPDPGPPVTPPGPDPGPPITPPDNDDDFVADRIVIKAPELINDTNTYSSYQLSFELYNNGQLVTIPPGSVTSVTYTFSDTLGVFDSEGRIGQPNHIPSAGSSIPVELELTIAKPYRVLTAQTDLIVKEKVPPPEPPNVIRSVYLDTNTIIEATALDADHWKMSFVFQNAKGEVIPPSLLPADLRIRIEDARGIFDENGDIANLHLVPSVNSIVPLKMIVESPSQGVYLTADEELTVVSGVSPKHYFAVSIMLQGSTTTVDQMEQARQLLMDRFGPNVKVTWALENGFVFVDVNRPQLQKVLEYVDQYGDEVGILDGYPNNLYELPFWEMRMGEWLYMYRYNALNNLHQSGTMGLPSVFESMDTDQYRKYLPRSLSSYTVNPEQTKWLKDNYRITSVMGWSATQYNVNDMYGEGSPLMPYWSHENNPMVPAQGLSDNSGTVFMNSVTIDPIGSRYTSNSSRWTLHPGDPFVNETDAAPQLYIAQQYLDNPYQRLNALNYLSIILDIHSLANNQNMDKTWENFVKNFPVGREIEIVGVDGLKQAYTSVAGANNSQAEFSLMFKGSGFTTAMDSNHSPANLRYLWTENASQRIILCREDGDTAWSVIDFTDYTRTPIPTTPYNLDKNKDISYVTGRNFKLQPTAPLTAEEIQRIKDRLQDIYFAEDVNYQ